MTRALRRCAAGATDRATVADCAVPRAHAAYPGQQLPYYRMEMRAFSAKLHRDLPPTAVVGL
jgi:spore coat protein A